MDIRIGAAGKIANFFIDSKLTPSGHHRFHFDGDCRCSCFASGRRAPNYRTHDRYFSFKWPGADAKRDRTADHRPHGKTALGNSRSGVCVYHLVSGYEHGCGPIFMWEKTRRKPLSGCSQNSWPITTVFPGRHPPPLIKPRYIDDVPILAVTFWSEDSDIDHYMLRPGGGGNGKRSSNVNRMFPLPH